MPLKFWDPTCYPCVHPVFGIMIMLFFLVFLCRLRRFRRSCPGYLAVVGRCFSASWLFRWRIMTEWFDFLLKNPHCPTAQTFFGWFHRPYSWIVFDWDICDKVATEDDLNMSPRKMTGSEPWTKLTCNNPGKNELSHPSLGFFAKEKPNKVENKNKSKSHPVMSCMVTSFQQSPGNLLYKMNQLGLMPCARQNAKALQAIIATTGRFFRISAQLLSAETREIVKALFRNHKRQTKGRQNFSADLSNEILEPIEESGTEKHHSKIYPKKWTKKFHVDMSDFRSYLFVWFPDDTPVTLTVLKETHCCSSRRRPPGWSETGPVQEIFS